MNARTWAISVVAVAGVKRMAFSASSIFDRHPISGVTPLRKEIPVNSTGSGPCIADINAQVNSMVRVTLFTTRGAEQNAS
jgi:hypothetical protein